MSRLKLLAAAMLLALPIISACGETPPPPPPTGSIDGLVSIEGQGQDGISVTLSNGATVTTANGGMFRFDGVEAGAYTVTISNYPDDASFAQTSAAATIATDGENVTVNFAGDWIRTAAIMGTVTVENEGLGGVTVKLSGMSDSETLTDGSGQYAFSGLRAGNYTVQISGFDEEDVAFGSTQSTAALAVGESKVVTFEGTYLRASAITGQVTVEDNPLEGVTVSLQGKGEDRTATTNGAGQFTFSELRRGDYSVGITNPDADEYTFEVTSRTVTIAHGETGTASFNGVLLRTATIIGTVTVENVGGIPATVTIQGGEKGQELTTTTNDAGQFRFTDLYAGDYSVGISGFDDDLYGFDITTATITVERKATATVKPFEGIELRTAGIEGTITVDGGHPLPGVTVTVTGGPKDEEHTRVTNDAGYYMVDELHAGVYTVAISDFDENEYEFEATTRTIDVGLRSTATVAFQGDLLRTGGISGRVSVGGTLGLDGITVTLSGDADGEMMTADGGQYAFSGLAEGDYMVEIEGWDDDLYAFEMTSAERHVAQDASEIVNFEGTHRTNNTVSGMLFIDEVMVDGMMTTGEPPFAIPEEALPEGVTGIPLLLQGPGVNEVRYGFSMPDGSYSFSDLAAGTYRVLVNETEDVTKLLAGIGFDFTGEATGAVVSVAGGKEEKVNFPFRITMQTINVGAVMGNDEETGAAVEGVSLAMYPTVQDAENGTNMLGAAGKTGEDGMATFHFMRAMDTGPDNGPIDHLVFIKVANTGHDDLAVSANNIIEVEYPSIARASGAPTAVRLLNTAVNFQWWVKSNADAVDGDAFLAGWHVVMGTDTITTDAEGKATYSGSVDVADVPATMSVMLDSTQADSLTAGEMWKQSDALKYTQNPLLLPADNMAEDNDLGALRVTWTTQTLVVGVYREMDDIVGYKPHTSHRREDDARPNARVAAEMDIQMLEENDRGRWVEYKWDHDMDPETDPMHPNLTVGANGLVKVRHLPAMAELRVELDVGAARTVVTDLEEVSTYGDDLMDGMTLGSFGPGGGGTGEVRLCTASVDTSTKDDDCATFGYQWTSGTITGRTSPAQRGIAMDLEAITANHGADDDDGKTGATGQVRFLSVQDATYDLTATGTADWAVSGTPTARIWCYHDENADETNESKADSAWVGTACAASQTYNLTQKGLEVRGFVANVSDEHLTVVRGDDTFEGAELSISKYVRANLADPARPVGGPPIAKTTVQADGSYVFEGLDAGRYVITAVNTSQYEALQSHPKDNVGGAATAAEYVAIPDERLLLGKLPRWDYENSEGGTAVPTSSVTVGTGTNAKTMTFHNFALLHKDGTFSGRVVEAAGNHGNIAVELRRCLVYTPATCSDDTAFTPAVQQTRSSGTWSYGGLREGYYQVNLAATGYLRARYGTMGIDDDAADCGPGTEVAAGTAQTCDQDRTDRQFDDLRGKTAFNETPSVYYVYNGNLSSGDAATAISVSGVETNGDTANVLSGAFAAIQDPQPAAGTEALGAASAAVSFDAASVRVRATVPSTASYVVTNETALGDPTYTPHRLTGAVVPLTYNRTAVGIGPNANTDINSTAAPANDITITVTAQNGYNDHDYTFTATRTNPIGNQLEAAEVQFRGTDASTTGGNGASGQPFRVTTANATTNSVIVTFDLEEVAGVTSIHNKCAQSVAVYAPGADDAMTAASNADSDFCSGEQYSLSAGSTGTTYTVVITSEDNRDWTYYVNVSLGS